jgi:hypothetical protein
MSANAVANLIWQLETVCIGEDSDRFSRGIHKHGAGTAMREVKLQLRSQFSRNIAFHVIRYFGEELCARDHSSTPAVSLLK